MNDIEKAQAGAFKTRLLANTYENHGLLWHDRARGSEDHVMKLAVTHLTAAAKYVPKDQRKLAVQAGGYCGTWPAFLAKMFEVVYTFEPDADNFRALANNAAGWNIYPFRAALGDKPGTATLELAKNSGSNQMLDVPGSTPIIRLDDLHLSRLDMLALDVEGFETCVYMGGERTIMQFSPVIIAEETGKVSKESRHFSYATAHDWLKAHGYKQVEKIDKDGIWTRS